MYINKIDELIDNVIENFYASLLEDTSFTKILEDDNFVGHQSEINKILQKYEMEINISDIMDIVNTEESIKTVNDIIKKYVAFYLFVFIGVMYKGKGNQFINNMLEFTKLQSGFSFKVPHFFNSDSNSLVIKFVNIIKNLTIIVEVDQSKLEFYDRNDAYKGAIEFAKDLSPDIIESLKLENLEKNKMFQAHNMVKLMILMELYFKLDKKEVYDIIEESQKTGEYIFIDILVPKKEFIDFGAIENVLTQKQNDKGLANRFYEMIMDIDSKQISEMTADEKIINLINKKILIPITDEFLLYHKDSEKYEKITNIQKKKQKDDTKLKYIISKIDSVADFYSDNVQKTVEVKKNVEKLFYAPLSNRNATLINNIEEIQIINKFYNQGTISAENSDFLSELSTYRQYPYINFKSFSKNGFTLVPNKTVDMVRSINFDEQNVNRVMEMRVGSELPVNIVGFILNNKGTTIECLKASQIQDIRKSKYVKTSENAYTATFKYIMNAVTGGVDDPNTYYWFFDLDKDKVSINKYEQVGKLSKQDIIKMLVANLYDDILKVIFNRMESKLELVDGISQFDFFRMIDHYDKKYLSIKEKQEYYDTLLDKAVYKKYIKGSADYDGKEDKFPGLDKNAIMLPTYKNKNISKNILLKVALQIEDANQMLLKDIIQYGAICQHNITWDNINKYDKGNENKFAEKLIDFIYKYAIENEDKDFICKSCGIQINLKKYILDGAYTEGGGFKLFNTPIKNTIENIPEYDKYKQIIRYIDKLLDKIANVGNIHVLQEKSLSNKNQLKIKVIKDSIDLIIMHNKNMRDLYRERAKRIKNDYGISDSYFFIFELDNEIFKTSSKDKDTFKIYKRNNIMIYLSFLSMLEVTDTQVLYMFGDKLCNFGLFEKVGMRLLSDIKIIVNDNKVKEHITDYPIMCYIVFYISCMLTKYNMWQTVEENKKFNPDTQKKIIYTLIDLINSILEYYCNNKKAENLHYLYDMLSSRFFHKLNTTFKNEVIMGKLKSQYNSKLNVDNSKTKYSSLKVTPIQLEAKYGPLEYLGNKAWLKCYPARKKLERARFVDRGLYVLSDITNCSTGEFHNWNNKGMCTKCNKSIKETKGKTDETYYTKYMKSKIIDKVKIYCPTGVKHKMIFSDKIKMNMCTLCDYKENGIAPTDNIVNTLSKNLLNNKRMAKEKALTFVDENIVYNDKLFKALQADYLTNKDFVVKFIEKIESNASKGVNINGKNMYINDDVYIIDHDHNGYHIDKPMIIKNSDNKILIKKNHNYYKLDVLYYIDKNLNIEVYYDNITFLLLGFKEKNKDYSKPKEKNAYIKINYSIYSKLKYLGYESKYVDISKQKEKLEAEYSYIKDKDMRSDIITKNIVRTISRNRINNLKKTITDIQKFIYRVKYNYESVPNPEELFDTSFMEKYKNKLTTIKLKNEDKKVFDDWETVKYDIFFKAIDDKVINIDFNDKFFNLDDVINYDDNGNIILYYIISEMSKLIDINEQPFIKNLICFLLIDIIDTIHTIFNRENEYKTYDLKKFKYIIESKMNVEEKDDIDIVGIYEEQSDPNAEIDEDKEDANYSDEEEFSALDVDGKMDYEVDYSSGVNFN
jgi:hypothetical protein